MGGTRGWCSSVRTAVCPEQGRGWWRQGGAGEGAWAEDAAGQGGSERHVACVVRLPRWSGCRRQACGARSPVRRGSSVTTGACCVLAQGCIAAPLAVVGHLVLLVALPACQSNPASAVSRNSGGQSLYLVRCSPVPATAPVLAVPACPLDCRGRRHRPPVPGRGRRAAPVMGRQRAGVVSMRWDGPRASGCRRGGVRDEAGRDGSVMRSAGPWEGQNGTSSSFMWRHGR